MAIDPASISDDLVYRASGSDADGDALTWSYGWTIDGADAGETANTLASGAFTKGQEVIALLNDGFEDGAPWPLRSHLHQRLGTHHRRGRRDSELGHIGRQPHL